VRGIIWQCFYARGKNFGVFSCEGQSEGAYDRGEDISVLMFNG